MTPDEWTGLSFFIEEWWPGEFTENTEKAWSALLMEFDREEVFAGLKALALKGGTFRPSVSEVLAEIRQDPSLPTGDELAQLLVWAGRLDTEARVATLHPSAQAFVRSMGGIPKVLGWRFELTDSEWGAANRRKLVEQWAMFSETHDGRSVRALVSGQRDGLVRLDPLAVLERPAVARIGSGT